MAKTTHRQPAQPPEARQRASRRWLVFLLGGIVILAVVIVGAMRFLNRGAITWQHATLVAQEHGTWSTLAPIGDGTTAYDCAPSQANGNQPEVYVTHDRGATWKITGPVADSGYVACYLVVDRGNQHNMILVVGEATPWKTGSVILNDPSVIATFLSTDAGHTWRQITLPEATGQGAVWWVSELGTVNGTTYLETVSGTVSGGSNSALYVSTDGMHTWKEVAPSSRTFWLEPDGTAYRSVGYGETPAVLEVSHDSGKTWTRTHAPSAYYFIGHPPTTAGGEPTFCAVGTVTGNQASEFSNVTYSVDGGQTWTTRVVPLLPDWPKSVSPVVHPPVRTVVGIDDSGALLTLTYDGKTYIPTLYRLVPGATSWKSLGQLPIPASVMVDTEFGVSHVLWAVPSDQPGPAYTATYT